MLDSDSEVVQLYISDDNGSQDEEYKKEKDDKAQIECYSVINDISKSVAQVFDLEDFFSLHGPEITTPPPEFSFFFS